MRFKVFFVICLLLTSTLAGFGSVFVTAKKYATPALPAAVAVQDFNNDGVSDIASANGDGGDVSVFLGRGDGTFAPANTFVVDDDTALEIASGNLNRDGNADLVVTDGFHSAYIILGHGDGTFESPSQIPLQDEQPLGIAIEDFNADGVLDLAIAEFGLFGFSMGKAAILMGNGDGTFAPPVYYSLEGHGGVRVVATDLNNDGKVDLAFAVQHFSDPTNGLAVILGNGDGTFQDPGFSVDGDLKDITAADFNGDGKVDLALTGYLSTTVLVVLGNGDGTFQPAITYSTEVAAKTVSAADLNGDGAPDLLLCGGLSNWAEVLLGDAAGNFGSPTLYSVGFQFARTGYFNDDAKPDIVAGSGGIFGPSGIGVALGGAQGDFKAPISYSVESLVGFRRRRF